MAAAPAPTRHTASGTGRGTRHPPANLASRASKSPLTWTIGKKARRKPARVNPTVVKHLNPRARDAWLCVLTLVALQLLLILAIRESARASPAFAHWLRTIWGLGFTVVAQGTLWLLSAFWFSRVVTVRDFVELAGLRQRADIFGWVAAWVSIVIACIDGWGVSRGLTASSRQSHPQGYDAAGAAWWFFALKSVLIVPFYEEAVTRGLLYRAFRRTYGTLIGTCIIVCVSTYFHWGGVSRSFFTFCCLASLWTLLCIVRERSGSLWNCLLCHAVYNCVGIGMLFPTALAMALLLPVIGGLRPPQGIR